MKTAEELFDEITQDYFTIPEARTMTRDAFVSNVQPLQDMLHALTVQNEKYKSEAVDNVRLRQQAEQRWDEIVDLKDSMGKYREDVEHLESEKNEVARQRDEARLRCESFVEALSKANQAIRTLSLRG